MTVDLEETRAEKSARIIDDKSIKFAERCDMFYTTLRSNARYLTPQKRQLATSWLKRHYDRLQTILAEGEEIPPLGLDDLPEWED